MNVSDKKLEKEARICMIFAYIFAGIAVISSVMVLIAMIIEN